MTLPFARFKIKHEIVATSDDKGHGAAKGVAKVSIEANSTATIESYFYGLKLYNMLFELRLDKYPTETLDKLIDFILPAETVPPSLMAEARATGQARYDIFYSGDWITAKEWYDLSENGGTAPDLLAQQYLRDRLIFSIRHADIDYFPLYALDMFNNFRPASGMHEVIELLDSHKDGWGFAFWFATPNALLGNKAPKDLIASEPHSVIAAALEEAQGLRIG